MRWSRVESALCVPLRRASRRMRSTLMKRTVRMSLLRRSAAPSTSGFAHWAIWSNGIDDATSTASHERAYLRHHMQRRRAWLQAR